MPHPVLDAAARYRAQLLAQERQAATRLVAAYGRAYTGLQRPTQALSDQIASLLLEGATPSEASIRKLAALQSLQAQIADQVNRYAVYADQQIANEVSRAIELGLRASRDTALASFTGSGRYAAMRARWDMLPAESVETMLGFTAEGSPLRTRLVNVLGEAVAQRAGDALVQGIVTGMGARQVANVLRREMGAGLTWSLTTARTANLWAYRDAARLNYMRNNDIVTGWKWLSAADGRTCMSCWAQHGSVHDVNEILADHHNGRCTQVPIVPLAQQLGLSEPPVGKGEEMFAALPETDQRQAMGPAMFEAWKAGELRLGDLSRPYSDPVYGTMLGQPALRDVVGEQVARKYIDMMRTARR